MKNIGIGLIAGLLIGVLVFIGVKPKKDEIVWVSIQEVYDGFDYKKELEAKVLQTQQARKSIIDSAEFELKVLTREIKNENGKNKQKISLYEIKREDYYQKKEAFESDNANMQQKYNEKILTQINQYLKEFGIENNYKYVLGATGAGTLMYAKDEENVTKEAIIYINEKYKGKTE